MNLHHSISISWSVPNWTASVFQISSHKNGILPEYVSCYLSLSTGRDTPGAKKYTYGRACSG